MVVMVWALAEDAPSFQATNAATDRAGGPAQLIAIHLRHDVHDAPIDRIALPGQLRQLLEQHLKTLLRRERRGRRGHDPILTAGTDKFQPPNPGRDQGRAAQDLTRAAFADRQRRREYGHSVADDGGNRESMVLNNSRIADRRQLLAGLAEAPV